MGCSIQIVFGQDVARPKLRSSLIQQKTASPLRSELTVFMCCEVLTGNVWFSPINARYRTAFDFKIEDGEQTRGESPASSPNHNRLAYAWNELPQPQLLTAFGFSKVKPCFSRLSYQSTVVPSRYKALFLSTTTATPWQSYLVSALSSTRRALCT